MHLLSGALDITMEPKVVGPVKVIGLTGGIASGKSTVASFLKELGAYVIDADKIAREIVLPGSSAYREIVREFGAGILKPDKHINRGKLGEIIFQNPEARKKLNEITHPKIYLAMEEQIEAIKKRDSEGIIVLDVPLLIETGMTRIADEVWLAWLPEEEQMNRLMERDGLTKEEAEQRIKSQMPLQEKRKFAHRIIDTSGLLKDTRRQVNSIWNQLKSINAC
ncbi:MAG: dephospho-CoA kinase [Bacillota bacterium]|jgi:dephospho-CoA kinase